ncbi:hypothetical protein HPB51_019847 [Rhipicephalus microplus]|uniref:Uncharacterized protein n=1 Tax=Rhipicephalus microplus TaxID=6941 RepID=A0A9J6DBH8_RHIMP|nr:hypothetical protein HPB51_019847 [Rhipicephalus microplus]
MLEYAQELENIERRLEVRHVAEMEEVRAQGQHIEVLRESLQQELQEVKAGYGEEQRKQRRILKTEHSLVANSQKAQFGLALEALKKAHKAQIEMMKEEHANGKLPEGKADKRTAQEAVESRYHATASIAKIESSLVDWSDIFMKDILYERSGLMKQHRSLRAIGDKVQVEKEDLQESLERATERVDTFKKEPAANASNATVTVADRRLGSATNQQRAGRPALGRPAKCRPGPRTLSGRLRHHHHNRRRVGRDRG